MSETATAEFITADVYLEENTVRYVTGITEPTYWTARLSARLPSGEAVEMHRTGRSAALARAALDEAVTDQGWEFRRD